MPSPPVPHPRRSPHIGLGLRDAAMEKGSTVTAPAPTAPVRLEDRGLAAPRPVVTAPRPTLHHPPRRSVRVLREDPGDLPLIIHMGDDGAFPSGRTYGPDVAGLAHRLLATLVDVIVLAIVDVLVLAITLSIAGLPYSPASFETLRAGPMAFFGLAVALLYVAGLTYRAGQTLGKRLVGIRVVDGNDGEVTLPQALLRAVGWLASLATLGALGIPALFDDRRRAVHDRLAGTHVLYLRK